VLYLILHSILSVHEIITRYLKDNIVNAQYKISHASVRGCNSKTTALNVISLVDEIKLIH